MQARRADDHRYRAVFFGTPEFAVPTLAALIEHPRIEISLVVTQPDRPAGRHRRLTPSPVKNFAVTHALKVYQPETLRGSAQRAPLLDAAADLFVVAAFGLIFGERTLAIPRLGCVNVHASCLPEFRGAAPVAAAILAGERKTGISLMKMDRGLDTGPLIAVANEPILATDTTESLTKRLATLGARLVTQNLAAFADGELLPQPQPAVGASMVRPLRKVDGWLDWSRPATELERRVRAMWPWPRAWTTLNGQALQIHQAATERNTSAAAPGIVITGEPALTVRCGIGAIRLERVQLAGGKPMSGSALVTGRHVSPGAALGKTGRPPPPPPFIVSLDEAGNQDRGEGTR